jgi:hypothetical protein
MSVMPIGGQMPAAPVQQVAGHGHGHGAMRKAGMEAAATALGMSTADLRSALQSGQTMASLASTRDTTPAQVATAISEALTNANPALSADRAQQIAQRMVDGPPSGGAPPAPSVGAPALAAAGVGGDRDNDGDAR